jgi:hypothetical protein
MSFVPADGRRLHQLSLLGCSAPAGEDGAAIATASDVASSAIAESVELLRFIAGILVNDGRRGRCCSVGLSTAASPTMWPSTLSDCSP